MTDTTKTTLPHNLRPGVAATKPQPGDLETRIKARRAELIAELVALKDDPSDPSAAVRDSLKTRLGELAVIIREEVGDGWAKIAATTVQKLERWLAR